MKRIEVIDGLRGFSLLGILLVNINFFNQSYQAINFGGVPAEGWLNQFIDLTTSLLVEGKFILLFSFLFGYGTVILFTKTVAVNKSFTPMYSKRMLALLLFGIIHGIVIWHGDILTSYALVGLWLLFFIRRAPKTVLVWAFIFTLLIPLLMTAVMILGSMTGTEDFTASDTSLVIQQYQEMDQHIYGEGTFAEIFRKRLFDYQSSSFNMLLFFPQIMGTFLLGIYFGKRQLLDHIHEKKPLLLTLGVVGGILGIILQLPRLFSTSSHFLFDIISVFIAAPLLMLAYMSFFALAFLKYQKNLMFFCYPGRLGFSMYILQSILCGIIFYSYGFGLFGKMELWQTTLTALVIYGFQVLLSFLWLRRFQTGPLEAMWRFLYRGKSTEMRIRSY